MKKQLLMLTMVTTLGFSTVQTIEAEAATIKYPESYQVYLKGSKLHDRMTKRPLKKYAQYKGFMYKNGVRLTGTVNGVYFKKGKLGTGIYKKKLYRSGQLASGLYEGKLYRSGVLNKEYYVYNDQLYHKEKRNVGIALYNKKLYLDDSLYAGYYVYEGVLYKDGRKNTTVVNVEGAWYTGATTQPGWIRTKQLGWIKIDDFGFQIKDAVPPPNLETGSESNIENPGGNEGNDMEPPAVNGWENDMEPPDYPSTSTVPPQNDAEPPSTTLPPQNDLEPPTMNGWENDMEPPDFPESSPNDLEPPTTNDWENDMEPPSSWGPDDWI